MSLPRLVVLLLRLYPRGYRARFEDEWTEIVAWHRQALEGRSFPRARLGLLLLFDTLKSVPAAHASTGSGLGGLGPRLKGWWRDAKYAGRALRRRPTYAAATVLSIVLGIAANTATFSVFNAVLLRPLPYANADRLAIVWNEFPGARAGRLPLSGPELQILREEPDLFDQVEGIWATSGTLDSNEGRLSQVAVGRVTPDFFSLFGVSPALGRAFVRDASEGPVPTGVIVSHELWRTRFGGDPTVVGGTLRLNGQSREVLGVLPEGFTLYFPEDGAIPPRLDVYEALPWDPYLLPPAQHYLRVVGRLRPGVDGARAAAGVTDAADRALRTYAELQDTGDRFSVHPLQEDSVRAARPVLIALLGAMGLFLLLASANVASLVLARTMARGRELAIRSSIGASRSSLARLVVTESLLVTLVGGLLGIAVGRGAAAALWTLRPAGLARVDAVPLDTRVLVFALGVSVLAGLVFAVLSLLAVRGADTALNLRSGGAAGGRAGSRVRELVTAAEVAIGLVLVVGSVLMVRSVTSLGRESIGFVPASALAVKVPINMRRFQSDAERGGVARELERRLAELPGVDAVGATSHLPFVPWANWAGSAPPDGTPEAEQGAYFADLRAVTPSYLPAIRASLVSGRFFRESDDQSSRPVVIIDSTMAARAFPGEDAVGRLIRPERFFEASFAAAGAVVVGVIRDLRDRSPSRPSTGQVFWPFAQSARWELTYFVRTSGDPAALAEDVERTVRDVDPDLAASQVVVMDTYVRQATALTRFLALVGTVFSALAVVLAAIGLYGVVAFVSLQRTHELGMRVVLGAARESLLVSVLVHGLRIGLTGVGLGVVITLLTTRFLSTLVYGVSPHDPATLAGVGSLLLVVALAASLGPAWRATRVDPLVALRDA